MSKQFSQVYDGDWCNPIRRGYRLRCCDCGLVHRVNFLVRWSPRHRLHVIFQPFRDERSTASARRTKKYAGLRLPTSKRKR